MLHEPASRWRGWGHGDSATMSGFGMSIRQAPRAAHSAARRRSVPMMGGRMHRCRIRFGESSMIRTLLLAAVMASLGPVGAIAAAGAAAPAAAPAGKPDLDKAAATV